MASGLKYEISNATPEICYFHFGTYKGCWRQLLFTAIFGSCKWNLRHFCIRSRWVIEKLTPSAALGWMSLRWVNLARGDPYSNKELNVKGWGLKCALFEPVGQRNTTAISIEHQMNRFLLLPNHSNSDQPIFCTGPLFSVFSLTTKIINSFTL